MIVSTRGSGIPLILFHGFGADHRILLPLESALDRPGWQRLYVDLPWTERARAAGAVPPTTPRELGDARAEFEGFTVRQTPEVLDDFLRFVMPGVRSADRGVLDRLTASYTDAYDPDHEASSPFSAPSLHVFGRQDQVVGFEDGWATRAHYPRGTFAVLDAAGHNVHLDQSRTVAALLRDWLERMEEDLHEPSAGRQPSV